MAFNAKNLTYESNEPAFLRRLKGQFGDGQGVRRDRPTPRPQKRKADGEDDDDGPTYVDAESNDTISKADYDKLIKGEDSGQATDEAKPEDKEESASKTAIDIKNGHVPKQEAVATIGGGGKRRLAKAVGLEENEPEKRELKSDLKGVKATKRDKKAKKTKKVKLSFDDE